jgi:hypothetical protein
MLFSRSTQCTQEAHELRIAPLRAKQRAQSLDSECNHATPMELQTAGEIQNMQSAHERALWEQRISAALTATLSLAQYGLLFWSFFSTGDFAMRLHDMMGMVML